MTIKTQYTMLQKVEYVNTITIIFKSHQKFKKQNGKNVTQNSLCRKNNFKSAKLFFSM